MLAPSVHLDSWDVVDEASLESFPASDPPGWMSAHAVAVSEPAADTEFLVVDDTKPRVLVLVDSHRPTYAVAPALCTELEERGYTVELADVATFPPPPEDYDAVVIGMVGNRARDLGIEQYVSEFHADLAALPTSVFVVGTPRRCSHAAEYATAELGRAPAAAAGFRRTWWHAPRPTSAELASFADHVAAALRRAEPAP